MNAPSPEDHWTPSQELLAAYGDGELDCHPQRSLLRSQIEAWLAEHPEDAAELEDQVELGRLMAETTAVEPSEAQWAAVWAGIERAPRPRWRWAAAVWLAGLAAAGAAAAAVVAVVLNLPPAQEQHVSPGRTSQPAVVDDSAARSAMATVQHAGNAAVRRAGQIEVLKVATSDEIEIIRIAGSDTDSMIVGRLPLTGPMVMIEPHEVEIMPPANSAGPRPELRKGMLWTPLPGENEDAKDEA
jgi:hypothetical protein